MGWRIPCNHSETMNIIVVEFKFIECCWYKFVLYTFVHDLLLLVEAPFSCWERLMMGHVSPSTLLRFFSFKSSCPLPWVHWDGFWFIGLYGENFTNYSIPQQKHAPREQTIPHTASKTPHSSQTTTAPPLQAAPSTPSVPIIFLISLSRSQKRHVQQQQR